MKTTTILCIVLFLIGTIHGNAQTKKKNENVKKAVGVAGAVLSGILNQNNSESKDGKKDNPRKASKKIDATKMNGDLVFSEVFGNNDLNADNEKVWKLKAGTKLTEIQQNILSTDDQFHTALDNIFYFNDAGQETAAAIFFTYRYSYSDYDKKLIKDVCRACSAVLGVATFQKQPDQSWKLFNSELFGVPVAFNAGAAERPEYLFKDFGAGLHLLAFSSDFGMGGEFIQMTNYIALDNEFYLKDVFSFENSNSYDSPQNTRQSYEIIKQLYETPTTDTPFKMLTLKTKRNGKPMPDEVYIFSKSDGRYIKKINTTGKKTTSSSNAARKSQVSRKTDANAPKPKPVGSPQDQKVKATNAMKMD